jgi:putative protein kinase ArgK-like GTPase of G3E family
MNISSTQNTGLNILKETIDSYFLQLETSGFIRYNRQQQQIQWFNESIVLQIQDKINSDENIRMIKSELELKIRSDEMDANKAAKILLEKIFSKK